ncbi:MAG TPA: low molecular weight protein-tyrosine-phosphatase [Mycobacteriales bacterium]|nr:low molecular weight protein-tyrosine-phosphatase [Mycobacteriales bacterium]
MPYRIVFVCLGNICRSPIAEIVMRRLVRTAGLEDRIAVESGGTGDWHLGEPADPRTLDVLRRNGYDGSAHRARQFTPQWFDEHDLVVAMDDSNLTALRRMAPPDARDKIRLLLSFDPDAAQSEVPDPYYGGADGFDDVLAMIEQACRALLEQVKTEL